jgi:hypothetical protein
MQRIAFDVLAFLSIPGQYAGNPSKTFLLEARRTRAPV